ncbi:MAG: hypothetical protein RR586_08395 [Cellulosilyticaceae bacterium]
MKKINWKIFNIALCVEVLLAYILPFKVINNFEFKVGFPISFISVYDTAINHNPMMSMHLNPVALLINGVIIYFIILGIKNFIRNFKH